MASIERLQLMRGFELDEARSLLGARVSATCDLNADLHCAPPTNFVKRGERGTVVSASRGWDGWRMTVLWDREILSGGVMNPKLSAIDPRDFDRGVVTIVEDAEQP